MASRDAAVGRWKILKKAILSARPGAGSLPVPSQQNLQAISVRSFTSFDLFQVIDIEKERDDGEEVTCGSSWKLYSSLDGDCGGATAGRQVCAVVRHLPQQLTLDSLTGFNNTGNVCIWPAEEVMAYYCLRQQEKYKGKSVLELGGGMTGLAGLMLSLTGLPSCVRLTDGNLASVNNIRHIIKANEENFGMVDISAEVLVWNQEFLDSDYPVFDYVICADCLFFTELHSCLAQVICKLLALGGEALLFNPRRSGTLHQFLQLVAVKGSLRVEEREKYEEEVWRRHERLCEEEDCCNNYKPDLHYPVMLRLTHSNPCSKE